MSPDPYRPIRYNYRAVFESYPEPTTNWKGDEFHFLNPRTSAKEIPTNAILLNPESLGLAWISSMKGCLQNIHWREAEDACTQLIQNVVERKGVGRVLPDALKTSDKARKSKELIETAVTIGIYLFPTATAERMRVLTQAIMFLFLHDDVVESNTRGDGRTVLEDTPDDTEHPAAKGDLFGEFAKEAHSVDPVLGGKLVTAARCWAEVTRNSSTDPGKTFASFAEYMDFRASDVGNEFLVAGVKFSCALNLSPEEQAAFDNIEKLYVRHASLINDLYSYEKERRESEESGAAPFNGVYVIHTLLGVSTDYAKNVVWTTALDCERQLREEYNRLVALPGFNDEQQRYLMRIIESTAGNVMYSSTTYRYARFTENLIRTPSSYWHAFLDVLHLGLRRCAMFLGRK
ncbi:isoprenoid synthase domain-containing protein [Aspergillus cavernicola]|uniref:Isoprenoid synthase domain-containing protein n=1 Tax=Aspergillus cavernicola TaxID=176166 RepID=A0ABR4HRX9_9EURO